MDDAHREHLRSQARTRRPGRGTFATPRWLEHSFVLPPTGAEVTAMPHQHVPDHDPSREAAAGDALTTDRAPCHTTGPGVRPPRDDVDFARLVRRAEVTRAAHRTASVAAGLSGLALIGYLLRPTFLVLVVLVAVALVAAGAFAVRMRLDTAPIPRVER